MDDIQIRRFRNDERGYQGCIEPASGKWQLCLDKEGLPHLFLRVWMDEAKTESGWLCVDDLLPDELEPAGMIDGIAGPPASDEEASAIHTERAAKGYKNRCPV